MADTKISLLPEAAALAPSDLVTVVSASVNKKSSAYNWLARMPSGATARNYGLDSDLNTIDSTAFASVIVSPSQTGFVNKIGAASKPAGPGQLPGWADDTGYVAGSASYAAISGGYDHVNNQIAGTICGGGHNFIQYNVNGHSLIGGGSYNWISGYRSSIVGGLTNKITGVDTGFAFIGGGEDNSIEGGVYNLICGGQLNAITSAGSHNIITGGLSNAISGTSTGNYVGGGARNVIQSGGRVAIFGGADNLIPSGFDGVIVGGTNNSLSANNGVVLGGDNCLNNELGAVTIGDDVKTIFPCGLHQSSESLVEQGDAQNLTAHYKARTTNATQANMTGNGGQFVQFDNAKTTAVAGKVFVVGVREDTGAASSYELEFMATWNGTTETISDVGGSGTTRNLNVISNGAGIVTPPSLALNTGAFRPKVTGIAAVNIKWSARMDFTMVLF